MAPALPRLRWLLLCLGILLSLSVYYANYGASFDEGETQGGGAITIALRAAAVLAIVLALHPFRFRANSATGLTLLYIVSGLSLLFWYAMHGAPSDALFVNTVLQLPVLLALVSTTWRVDHARWFRFTAIVLALQTVIDGAVWLLDFSLWTSQAFVGGVGNPSSFGMLCSAMVTFLLLHPRAGRHRYLLAGVLCVGAAMSKSLFAVLAIMLVVAVWASTDWRRLVLVTVALMAGLLVSLTVIGGSGDDDTGFVEHKLNSAGALIGLVEYDVESSATVSLRVDMHRETFDAIAADPWQLAYGHLRGQAYWPMDSQLLTYLGSFGALMTAAFFVLHGFWIRRAMAMRRHDGGMAALSLVLFGLIFLTNRILDYFPVATFYFVLVAMALELSGPFRYASRSRQAWRHESRSST